MGATEDAASGRAARPGGTADVAPTAPQLTVVGSINLDLVATAERLPRPGETVSEATFTRHPGGKGGNQALAAARLGARVRMVGSVGDDDAAGEATLLLHSAGVELDLETSSEPTGVALITVDASGETTIVVAPGANRTLHPRAVEGPVLCQLEIPDAVVFAAADRASFFCLNAAPARPIDVEPDLLVVNRIEHETASRGKLVALTLGAEGAALLENGREVARAVPPPVDAIDGTAAGDAFTACLVVCHLEGRDWDEALRRACAAGAIAASRPGAQPSLPTAEEVDEILG